MELHVYIDASNFALGVMLEQKLDNIIDKLIYYASRLMNSAKKTIPIDRKGSVGHDLCNKKNSTLFIWK